jgi:hypothetical protein
MDDSDKPSCSLCGIWSSVHCPPSASPPYKRASDIKIHNFKFTKNRYGANEAQQKLEIVDWKGTTVMMMHNRDEEDFVIKTNIWSSEKSLKSMMGHTLSVEKVSSGLSCKKGDEMVFNFNCPQFQQFIVQICDSFFITSEKKQREIRQQKRG